MADGVTHNARLKLHQTLHGYADGHRQLAASVALGPRDEKTMLVLSDISGSGASIGEDGYLTGYPLIESGVYALARTWAAPEMPRPGCVWTHTILIDFADLATLTSLFSLASHLHRPNPTSIGDYKAPLTIDSNSITPRLSDDSRSWGRRLLSVLYEKPRCPVVSIRPMEIDVDTVLLAIWAQQWPRLRRTFRFCTLAVADRSTEGNLFDLQILPSADRSVRARFPNVIDAEAAQTPKSPWLDEATDDLITPDHTGLRGFLRRVGGDMKKGREGFRPLCDLHRLSKTFNTQPEAISEAIELLETELGAMQARTAHGLVADAGLKQAEKLDHASLDFVIEQLDLVNDGTLSGNADSLGRAIWHRGPEKLIPLLEETGGPRRMMVAERALGLLRIDELTEGLRQFPPLTPYALAHRPEIVGEPVFWSTDVVISDDIFADDAFATISSSPHLQSAALTAMIRARRDDFSMRATRELGANQILPAVAHEIRSDEGPRSGLEQWIGAAVSDLSATARFLGSGTALPRSLLVLIAREIAPDALPSANGTDPWLIAVRNATGPVSEDSALFLDAYLLSRALGSCSLSPAELVQLTFDSIHSAAAGSLLPERAWHVMEHRLPSFWLWLNWDRCLRIRTAVVRLFVDQDLAPEIFARITKDDALFETLARSADSTSRGRDFLKRVKQAMKNETDSGSRSRMQMIKGVLDT
uniref:Uncharacterized protein n=1 Tax=Candidatus Kentrum sp. DK TaxID=2126562 RepID=A0A450SBK0_9GAMM|nr:MAG: hypothetical protein BECKDK2373C_GA0170839_102630 [Candidatus Kentron sp. DK]